MDNRKTPNIKLDTEKNDLGNVIDLKMFRLEKELKEKGIHIKKNHNNQVKMLIKINNSR